MQIDRIKVSVGRTVNLGDYNSLKIEAGLEAQVSESEDIKSAYDDAWTMLDKELERQIDEALSD